MTPPEPSRRLPEAAKRYWRARLGLNVAGAALLALALADLVDQAGLPGLLPLWVVLGLGAVVAAVVPELRWRRWSYEIREEEIDLRHGTFTVRRTLVPMRRIQHVDTESGPLQGWLDLATVSFHTAAGRTEIPALGRGEAGEVRARVGELARVRDDV